MTNLEWIQTLPAVEMARLLDSSRCDHCLYDRQCSHDGTGCVSGITAWLHAEHEEPDTWEKVEEDARKVARYEYFHCNVDESEAKACETCSVRRFCYERQTLDLVRRCKALAGVGE